MCDRALQSSLIGLSPPWCRAPGGVESQLDRLRCLGYIVGDAAAWTRDASHGCQPGGRIGKGHLMPVTLDRMKKGSTGTVVDVVGGRGVVLKLSAQGIVPGKTVEKVGHLRGGPVLLRVGGSQVAIGLGLARKVLVEVI